MKFKNPDNGFEEAVTAPGLWALLFGGLYFISAGLWAPFVIWLLLAVVLYASMGAPATVLMLVVNFVFAVFAPGMVRNSFLRKGWVEQSGGGMMTGVDGNGRIVSKPAASDTRKCPFCAEDIKAQAIKCKHCGSDLAASVEA